MLAQLEKILASLFTSSTLINKLEEVVERAFLKYLNTLSDQAKAGTLPESLQPFSPILEFVAEVAIEVFAPKSNP